MLPCTMLSDGTSRAPLISVVSASIFCTGIGIWTALIYSKWGCMLWKVTDWNSFLLLGMLITLFCRHWGYFQILVVLIPTIKQSTKSLINHPVEESVTSSPYTTVLPLRVCQQQCEQSSRQNNFYLFLFFCPTLGKFYIIKAVVI